MPEAPPRSDCTGAASEARLDEMAKNRMMKAEVNVMVMGLKRIVQFIKAQRFRDCASTIASLRLVLMPYTHQTNVGQLETIILFIQQAMKSLDDQRLGMNSLGRSISGHVKLSENSPCAKALKAIVPDLEQLGCDIENNQVEGKVTELTKNIPKQAQLSKLTNLSFRLQATANKVQFTQTQINQDGEITLIASDVTIDDCGHFGCFGAYCHVPDDESILRAADHVLDEEDWPFGPNNRPSSKGIWPFGPVDSPYDAHEWPFGKGTENKWQSGNRTVQFHEEDYTIEVNGDFSCVGQTIKCNNFKIKIPKGEENFLNDGLDKQ